MPNLNSFLLSYEEATNSHDFEKVRPFISPTATYFFSDETLVGIEAIDAAFNRTWARIQNEVYSIRAVSWIAANDTLAICTYAFHWTGTIDGEQRTGAGRGTNVLRKESGDWHVVHEHLSTI